MGDGQLRRSLFTIIVDYRGGTYVSQVDAVTPKDALRAWAKGAAPSQIQHLGKSGRRRLVETIDERMRQDPPVPLDDVTNVWFATVNGMLINVVKTSQR